jgi:hypothetical protein
VRARCSPGALVARHGDTRTRSAPERERARERGCGRDPHLALIDDDHDGLRQLRVRGCERALPVGKLLRAEAAHVLLRPPRLLQLPPRHAPPVHDAWARARARELAGLHMRWEGAGRSVSACHHRAAASACVRAVQLSGVMVARHTGAHARSTRWHPHLVAFAEADEARVAIRAGSCCCCRCCPVGRLLLLLLLLRLALLLARVVDRVLHLLLHLLLQQLLLQLLLLLPLVLQVLLVLLRVLRMALVLLCLLIVCRMAYVVWRDLMQPWWGVTGCAHVHAQQAVRTSMQKNSSR